MSTNLLAYASHHRRWLDKFPATLAPVDKLKSATGVGHNSFKLSEDVTERKKHLLFNCWNASPLQREIILAKTPPKAFMGILANKFTVVMHFPSLIQRACIPEENITSHPDFTFGKMKEAAIVGFKVICIN